MMKYLGAIWGVVGISLLLGIAIMRLLPHSQRALSMELNVWHWVVMVAFTLFMLYSEGYKGFQKKFSPRTAARALYLCKNPKFLHVLLAPFFCMGYFFATKKTKIIAYSLTFGVIVLIVLMRYCMGDPWRGVLDVGVICGLSYGLLSFWIYVWQSFTHKSFSHSPEIP